MKISSNQFSKKSFNKVSATWARFLTGQTSSNIMAKKTFLKGTNSWEGTNLSEGAYGVDDPFGGVDSLYGTSPYGSLAHFKLRQNYDVTH